MTTTNELQCPTCGYQIASIEYYEHEPRFIAKCALVHRWPVSQGTARLTERERLPINNQNEMDAAFGKGFFEMSLHGGKPAIRCSVPTEFPAARAAWAAVANAMATPQGRRVLAAQAVDEAVADCPSSLDPRACRVALMRMLGDDPDPYAVWMNIPFVRIAMIMGNCEEYERAEDELLRGPPALLPRPARWSGGRR